MTPEDVRSRVQQIRESAGDDEIAHGLEDKLWRDVLTIIASAGSEWESAIASEALVTQQIEFSRWRA